MTWVPLAHTVIMVDAGGWGPLLLGGLSLLDDLLPMAQCARGSHLLKLETTALAVGAKSEPPWLISIL